MLNFTFLGTGTSGGVPEVGCFCSVCRSDDSKDKRTRCSSYVEKNEVKILLDVSIDFRVQALREKISQVDAIFLTHPHADHCLGIDDLRSIQFQQGFPIDFFARTEHLKYLQQAFSYLFTGPEQKGGGVVKINPLVFTPGLNNQIEYKGFHIRVLNIHHGILEINAYVIDEKIAYITDCHTIDEKEWRSIYKIPILIINNLRYQPHKTHLHFRAVCKLINQIKPGQTYFIHMTHDISHRLSRWRLPANCELAYDGLKFAI